MLRHVFRVCVKTIRAATALRQALGRLPGSVSKTWAGKCPLAYARGSDGFAFAVVFIQTL